MELLRRVIFFSALAGSIAQRSGVAASPSGSRLSYRYSTSTDTFLQGRAYKRSSLSLESTVVVEVLAKCHRVLKLQDVQIKTIFESRERPHVENNHLRGILERHPLWFCFHNGKILKIFPQDQEPTWALNLKRGILSVFQTLPGAAVNSSVEEVDIMGKCPTEYQRRGALLWKTKRLNLCSHRFSGSASLRSTALPSAAEQLPSSSLECIQRLEEGILLEAKCTDSHLITPPGRAGSGVMTQTQTSLKLFRTEADILARERGDPKENYESSLLYEKEKLTVLSTEEEVAATLQKLCMKPAVDAESADLFVALVFELRSLSAGALLSLWRTASSACRGGWKPLTDALPSCATEACVVVMKEVIVSEEVEEDKVESFLRSLAFLPKPTTGMIEALATLLKLPGERQSAFLGISALVNHFCSMRNDCVQEPAVRGIMKILEGRLGRKCTLHDSRGIGQRAALLHLYQNYNENVEIRIASYLMSMKCPSEELFNQVKRTLQEEKSSQVGSFVWSHLSELLGTDDPLKQHLRNSLPDDILDKHFDGETWKYSSYSDATIRSAGTEAGANAETRIVFSPSSFIPRSLATNLTIHLLGRAVNLLEVGVRLENVEDTVQKFFGFQPVQNAKGSFSRPEPPDETIHQTPPNKPRPKRFSHHGDLPPKEHKPRLRKEENCPREQYNKMSELVKQFTKRMGKKKPRCALSMRIFGNELVILDCGDLRSQAKHHYLNLAELMVKLLKGQDIQFNKRMSLATEVLQFPSLSGLPVLLALNASAAVNVTMKGNLDFKSRHHFFVNGYIKPSAVFQLSAQMGTVGALGKTGLSWSMGLRSSTSLDGGIQVKKGKELKVFLNTPEESMEIVDFSSKLFLRTAEETETVERFSDHIETKSCTNEDVSKALGWQLCSEFSYPANETSGFLFPFFRPAKAAVTLKKQDRNLHQYLLKAAYSYNAQRGSWIPNEAGLHFFMGTPKAELQRDVAIHIHASLPQKKFGIEFIHPKRKIRMNGRIETFRNTRAGHLELILDDGSFYYIKGRSDLQAVPGEQRYSIHLEAKLLKHGSPIILSGNVTKQAGKKMAFSASLINLLKDTAFLAMCLEKKADDKLKQYSLEGEGHLPGVLGSHVIALLQQRGRVWSSALRIKYGLFGKAKQLQHECNMGQKLKVENRLREADTLDLDHELHCSQILTYNHKVRLHHEETASQLQSQLEVNYGKHWDEINNRKRVTISQIFRNNSYPALTSYFMEFSVQVPEKQVDYRTQLQHSHASQNYPESSTSLKVHYNNRTPVVAGLQWKDSSRHPLKKWEGTFNMDTPWLYLYAAHKLHQPQRSAYVATVDLAAGKAFVLKGLALELFCRDRDGEQEGRIRIYAPATTYLQASTVNRFRKGFLHSQSEVGSLWTQPIKNEIHLENNDQAKVFHFTIKSAKQEINMTAAYFHLEMPQKTNVSVRGVWMDHKSRALVLQLEAQIEEVRREKMFYQKRGTVQFRHPFKLPIPGSFLIQETFTVNKKEKHYYLETKVLVNGVEESVQTLTLGYQAEHPYICARLAHPYNSQVFPQTIELCTAARTLSQAKREVEANLKTNGEEILSFLGKYHNKSGAGDSQHLVQMNMAHSFQLKFPQSLAVNGKLFSREIKPANFAWGVAVKTTINQQGISQYRSSTFTHNLRLYFFSTSLCRQFSAWLNGSDAGFGISSQLLHLNQSNFAPSFKVHATTSRYGGQNHNGSFYLHSGGKDLIMLEADFVREMRKNTQTLQASTLLKQAIVTQPECLWLQFTGKRSPARVTLSSAVKLNEQSFRLGVTGSKEQKGGPVLTLHSSIQHNLDGVTRLVPQELSLDGSLKCKNNLHEGILRVMVNQSAFGIHIRTRNAFGNASFHNITVGMTQNVSQAFLKEAKIRGQLELQRGLQKCAVSIRMDTGALCVDLSNLILQEQIGVTGSVVHNFSTLSWAGLPTENRIAATYGHRESNRTGTLKLQGGGKRLTATFRAEKLPSPFQAQLTMSLTHNLAELKQRGMPFSAGGTCYYRNFSQKLAVGVMIQAGEEEFAVELENRGNNSAAGFSLFFHHNMGLLQIIPSVIQAPARILLNGSMFSSNCTSHATEEGISADNLAQSHLPPARSPRHTAEIHLSHVWPYLGSLGLAQENWIKLSAVEGEAYKGLMEVALGGCMFTGNGELSPMGEATAVRWRVILLNKCDLLENVKIPLNLDSGGSFLQNNGNATLTSYFRSDGQAADVQLEMSSVEKYTLRGTLTHSVSRLHDLGLPPKNAVALSVTNDSSILGGRLSLDVGSCSLVAQGEIQPQGRMEWTLEMETDCTALQELEVPTRIDASGHISMGKMHLDCQVMLTLGEKTLHGLLLLKVTNRTQDFHAQLGHNVQGAALLGIPGRTVVDLILERDATSCKRLLQFSVDEKQIAEELSFTQESDRISLNYRLLHNLETLQALWIQDRVELQAIAALLPVKNLTAKFQYGSCWVIFRGQMQKTGKRLDFTGGLRHKWAWMLKSDIPEAIQMKMSLESNITLQRWVQAVSGHTWIAYTAPSVPEDRRHDMFCCSLHNDTAVPASSYPNAINLSFSLRKLENKAAFRGQNNTKSAAVTTDTFAGSGLSRPFELVAEAKHSLHHLERLGLPFALKLTLREILSANKVESSLKLSCEPNLNVLFNITAKSKWQREELHIQCLQNLPFLLPYFPTMAEVTSKVNYATKEGEGKFSVQMENQDLQVWTKLAFTGTNQTHVLQLSHTIPQFTILPRQFILTTAYQKSRRIQGWSCNALWDGQEASATGIYTGLFPKMLGSHNIKVEICHPFLIPFPQHSAFSMHAKHSAHTHRDEIVVRWNSKEQVSVSSSLKLGKDRISYDASVAHPFNFTVKHVEVSSLTEQRSGAYKQQMQLAWDDGEPAHLKYSFGDKSKANITLWDACIAASSSQLRNILPATSLQACGSLEQTATESHQHLDLKWDGRKIAQTLTYEKGQPSRLDKIQVEVILDDAVVPSCAGQRILGRVETDYSAWLLHDMSLDFCGLPGAITLSGKHHLNKGDVLLQSEGRLTLSGDEGLIVVSLRNQSQAKVQNYSTEILLQASDVLWLDVMGRVVSSTAQSQILVEGKMDPQEKVRVEAFRGKGCLRYYMGYLKGNSEEGLEAALCMESWQHAALRVHRLADGERRDEVGRLSLEASNQSVALRAHGCGSPALQTESKLAEIASDLQQRLVAKFNKLEDRLEGFRKSVQHVEFLHAAFGWPIKASQEVAASLQSRMREITQVWRESGVKRLLQDYLPLYLGKLQDIMQQVQMELRKPLATLKDVYYDVTSKRFDEVWQQKTEAYLQKLQAFVPTIVKDTWLMEPVRVSLRALKMGLDMATQQMLSWAEAKFSRAVRKLQKSLSNLYHFSARNCSVVVRLPVMPQGEPTLHVTNLTNYLIGEKLIKPLRSLHHIALAAEYYRFKRSMVESPFEHHALLIGSKHLRTFDGKMYRLSSNCSVLLAKDFLRDAFAVILNVNRGGEQLLHIEMNGTAVIIHPEEKIYKKYNYSLLEDSCQHIGIPLRENGIAAQRESDHTEVSVTSKGALFSCDLCYELCTLTLDGRLHGASAGLLGTNDNEGGNEWMLPDHSNADSLQEFIDAWQVSNTCSQVTRTDKPCLNIPGSQTCKAFFQDPGSLFRNCFKVVDPEPFYELCTTDMCEPHSIKEACSLAAAFVHLCNRNFVPLQMPLQCGGFLGDNPALGQKKTPCHLVQMEIW
ncbi:uncharacterized protein LOC123025172 [Varanus komodoensis]|uniref:uncharacterized protein LOC123025172 n=1 Tax=Varanus komodoensis TaxID=61221 RepID=UPI001CF777DE|nr:uncharacterized protein LOC123025172 [Varanus komodoensis]